MLIRRTALLGFCLVLLLGSLSAVFAGGEGESDEIELRFWSLHTGDEQDFMAELAQTYSDMTDGVTILYEAIPQSEYLGAALTTAFAAGQGPDVFLISPGDFLKYANSGIALDLTPYFTPEIRADFLDSSIEAVTVNDQILAVPFEIELLGLYYNREVLNQNGVEPPATWDEFIAATAALTTDNRFGSVIEPTQGYFQNFLWYPFLWQNGGTVLDSTTMESRFDSSAARDALQLWRDLIEAGAARSLPTAAWDATYIGDGSTAMQVSGTWIINTLESTYPETDIGVVPLPVPPGGVAATDAGGWKFMANSQSEHAEEAARFLMWAMAENVEWPLRWCTEVKFAYSPRRSVIEAGQAIYNQGLREVFTQEIYASAIGEPRYPAQVVNIVGEAIQQAMFTDRDIDTITADAGERIDEFLATFEGSM